MAPGTVSPDLTGKRFSRLTATERAGTRGGRQLWLCRCDCGNTKITDISNLRRGATKSCGCLRSMQRSHGMSRTSYYSRWRNIKNRCFDANNKDYKNYGARGIGVCEQWLNSFEAFMDDMGLPPSPYSTIERIDNNGDYEPSNCRWATRKEQAQNRRHCWATRSRTQNPKGESQ